MTRPSTTMPAGVAVSNDTDHMLELQRFAELGRLSASLLHEISNPLSAAILHLEQHPDQQSFNIKHARRNIQLLQRYIEAARQQVRQESPVVSFYIRPQVDQIRRIVVPVARRSQVQVRFQVDDNYKVFGDPVKFQHIIANIIINAIDSYATCDDTHEPREVSVRFTGRQPWLFVRVSDRGVGMTTDELEQLFKPFYTTKIKAGKGLGMGLTIVKQYVERDFQGSVSVKSAPNQGTQFVARLRTTPRYQRLLQN